MGPTLKGPMRRLAARLGMSIAALWPGQRVAPLDAAVHCRPMQPHHALKIADAARAQHDSPEHRRFKTLLTKIDAARSRLAAWQEQLPLFAEVHAEQVQPAIERLMRSRRAWALELEQIASRPWSKADAQTLAAMIFDLCVDVLDAAPEPDPEIQALYERFGGQDPETEQREELASMKSLFESLGGVDLGDEPIDSMDELMRRARAQLGSANETGAAGEGAGRARPARRTAARKRAEDEARRITQTVREVYRKLAAALHPDRTAAGATEAERAERLALMQRANAAYEGGDLLALLSIQLQIEQVDVAHAAGVAAAQVKHFNKVLAEQLREIEAEIDERQMAFAASYGIVPAGRLRPDRLGEVLKQAMRDLAAAEVELAREQRALRAEPAAVRRWLKGKRAQMKAFHELDALIDNPMTELIDRAMRARPGGRR